MRWHEWHVCEVYAGFTLDRNTCFRRLVLDAPS